MKSSISRRLDVNAIPPTESILEIKASTRAYPTWWTIENDFENSNRTLRRESIGEVLERNLVFVDTPGYGSSNDVPFPLSQQIDILVQ